MNKKDVGKFELLEAQMRTLYSEIEKLVKKNPNDAINIFKLKLINGLLRDANEVLVNTKKPILEFAEFDESSLPSNSDALVVLSQYLTCLESYRENNVAYDEGEQSWFWVINGRTSEMPAAGPRKYAS